MCTQRCYGRHNVSRKSVNHWWFIDFIAWRYFTPIRDGASDSLKYQSFVYGSFVWGIHVRYNKIKYDTIFRRWVFLV